MKSDKTYAIRVYFRCRDKRIYEAQLAFEHYCFGDSTYRPETRAEKGFVEPVKRDDAFINDLAETHPLTEENEGMATYLTEHNAREPTAEQCFEFMYARLRPEDAQLHECLRGLHRYATEFAAKYKGCRPDIDDGGGVEYIRSELIELISTEGVTMLITPGEGEFLYGSQHK